MDRSHDTLASHDGVVLSLTDSIKLHAATMMSVCGALDAAGLVSHQQMAHILTSQIDEHDTAPWARIVGTMAAALATRAEGQAQALGAPAAGHPLVVIQGGRCEREV